MKRFQMITEADARVLEYGSTVTLIAGGHVTPLAADTLKARRITLAREGGGDADAEDLAPRADIRTVAIGGDHTSVKLKDTITAHLRGRGIAVHDLGTNTSEPVDYPDTAAAVALQVARGEADAGIAIDGAGIGSTIAANKLHGVRAAMCTDRTLARYAREHNGANVLTLGATLVSAPDALEIVDTFLATSMRDARYIRRLAKVRELERRPQS
jgi:ribose 5-phosphate isomerase B